MDFFITIFHFPDPCPVWTSAKAVNCNDAERETQWLVRISIGVILVFGAYSMQGFGPSKSTFNPSCPGDSAILRRSRSEYLHPTKYSSLKGAIDRPVDNHNAALVFRSLPLYAYQRFDSEVDERSSERVFQKLRCTSAQVQDKLT